MLRNLGLVESLSLAGARYIKGNGGHPDVSVGTLRFSLQLWISLIMIILLAGAFGLFLGTAPQTLFVLLSICVLRYFSGGWHFRNLDICVVFTTAVVVLFPLISDDIGRISLVVMNGASFFLVLYLAPTGHGQKFSSNTQKSAFKWIAAALVLINFIPLYQLSTISFFCQSLTLITLKGGKST
jgi:accessory gene regulator B